VRRLWDAYAFGGFRVQPTVRGVFGDPKARIVSLGRRSKKRCAATAQECSVVGTTEEFVRFGICRAGIRGCIWSSRFGDWIAEAAAK
jgi:hypothetical protein